MVCIRIWKSRSEFPSPFLSLPPQCSILGVVDLSSNVPIDRHLLGPPPSPYASLLLFLVVVDSVTVQRQSWRTAVVGVSEQVCVVRRAELFRGSRGR